MATIHSGSMQERRAYSCRVADHPLEEDDDGEVLDHRTCAGNIIIEVLTIVCTSLPRLRHPFLVLDHSPLVRNSKVS